MAKRVVITHVKSDFSIIAHFPVLALPQFLNLSLYRKVSLLVPYSDEIYWLGALTFQQLSTILVYQICDIFRVINLLQ